MEDLVRRRRRDRAARGMTLVELMVALAVAGIVMSSAFVFFAAQRRVYDAQIKVLGVQQNLWAAMETLSRFVRSAGTGAIGCVNDTDPAPAGNTPPATGLRAYIQGPPAQVVRLAPLWIKNGADGAPDEITVVFGTGGFGSFSDASLAATVQNAGDPITVKPGLSTAFRAGEFGLLVDYSELPAGPPLGDRGCTLFQVTAIDGGTDSLLHDSSSPFNPNGNAAGLVPFDYLGGAAPKAGVRNFGALAWVKFSIDRTGQSPRLMMTRLDGLAGPTTPQVLADGIEDMQIAYGCDLQPGAPGTPDGVLTEGTDAASKSQDEWTFNATGDAVPANCARPQAVRLTLMARSTEPDDVLADVTGNAKAAAEDGAAGAKDNYRHRILTTVVHPRNR